MKITEKQLKEHIRRSLVKKLNEQSIEYRDILPGENKEFYEFAEKFENFLIESSEKLQELREEGRKIMKADILGGHDSSVKSAERNRYIQRYVGYSDRINEMLIRTLEQIIREV